tara:strand:+ start:57 stop:860 length:804 start_codon:yes stop_codon:yes gene_type:complete
MNYKYIIGSGCSFTESHESWINSFDIENKINLSRGGCGNKYIQDSIIKLLSTLFEQNVSVDEILVGVQFTGIARLDFIASEQTQTINNSLNDFYQNTKIDKKSAWIHSGGANSFVTHLDSERFQDKYFENFYKHFMTDLENWYNFLIYVITLQSFLKSHNIKYFFHTGWNLFTTLKPHTKNFVHNFEKFKVFNYLWNQVDQDKFIFCKSNLNNISHNRMDNYSEYGGMWQYLYERDGINFDNDHPNEYGHEIWGKYLKEQAISRGII